MMMTGCLRHDPAPEITWGPCGPLVKNPAFRRGFLFFASLMFLTSPAFQDIIGPLCAISFWLSAKSDVLCLTLFPKRLDVQHPVDHLLTVAAQPIRGQNPFQR